MRQVMRALVWSAAIRLSLISVVYAALPVLPVPDTIKAEGVPPIPLGLSTELNRYQNIRSASFQDWESDGSGMYILTRFAEVPQVHFVAAPSGNRQQLTFLRERVLGVSARPKHKQFLYSIDEGGAENYQLFLQDHKNGTQARRLTDGKSRNISPKWSPSGELLAWSSNARNGRDMDLYVAAPGDPRFVRLFKEVTGQWTVADWSPDETKVVAVEYISINESYIHIIEVATGKTETLTPRRADPKGAAVSVSQARWSKDGRSIYYLSDRDQEVQQLVRHDLESSKTTSLPGHGEEVTEFELSEGPHIAVVVNSGGFSQILVYTDPLRPMPNDTPSGSLPPGQISGLDFRPDSAELAFTYTSARSPSEAYVVDLNRPVERTPTASNPVRWTFSETGGLDTTTCAEPQLISYRSFDGRKIPAFVYRPSARKFPGPRPVLISIHGGPESQFRPGFMARLNYLIDTLGLSLILPNVRGSTGYGKTYQNLDNGSLRADSVKDIGALLDWIATQPDLDKSRVGVTGGSYGGFMSLAVQTTYNDRIKAGIDVVGISNFVTFLQNTQGYRRDLRRAEYGDERDPRMRSYLEQISPLSSAAKIRTPILVVQGQNDPRVPISEAEQMVAALKKNGVPLWYVIGTNEGHGFAKKVNQDYLQAVEVVFLERYLIGNGEAKAENARKRYPVSGTTEFNAKPIASGTITFHPRDPAGSPAVGTIENGAFTLTTRVPGDGAIPGEYTVTIVTKDRSDGLPVRYASHETSALRCRIEAHSNTIDFHIAN